MTEMQLEQALFWERAFGYALVHVYVCGQEVLGLSYIRSPGVGESASWLLREVL